MKFIKWNPHLLVLCVAALYFFMSGAPFALHSSMDFVPVYTGARCLIQGCNPYETSQLQQQYYLAGGGHGEAPSWYDTTPVYPPSTFLVLSPLTVFHLPLARLLWFLLNGSLFAGSAAIVLSMCPERHRWLATTVVAIIVAGSKVLLMLGQPAVVAISLLIIGVYLLLRGRLLPLAAALLAVSLAVKPQIGGLIVLYFLVKRIHWRYAALALAGALALLLSGGLILKMHPRSADWVSDLRANISTTLEPGAINDPRPVNQKAVDEMNLQPVISIFFANAWEFNATAYAIFLALLVVWITAVLRMEGGLEVHLLALGALAVLSLMPIYHRDYDCRLLLLTVPAAMIVFQKRRFQGTLICLLTILSAISFQHRMQLFLLRHAEWQSFLHHKLLFILVLRQQNLDLLILFCLFVAAIFAFRSSGALAIESDPVHPLAISSPAGS